MYTKRTNASSTNNLEKGSASEETKLDFEGQFTKEVDVSRSVCYGLTWTPSRDEKLSTKDISPGSLTPPRSLNTDRINDKRGRYSFSIPYEFNQFTNLPKADRENCLEIHKTLSTRASTTIAVSKDQLSYEYWLSGEKFFETPPSKNYNEENDIYTIPTRDKSDEDNVEEKMKHKELDLDRFKLSPQKVYNSGKTLIEKIDDLKTKKEKNEYGEPINKIRRSSSAFSACHVEKNVAKINVDDPSSGSMIENVTSSTWNVVKSVSTLGRTNVHNHIYLSSGCLDRYFDVPLSKIFKLSRRNVRVRSIRRGILKRPKRSKSRLIGSACRITSMLEMQSVNRSNKQAGGVLRKKNVFNTLAEIDTELSIYFKSVEKFQEQLPSYIHIEAIFTMENKRTLNEIAKRCRDYVHNSYDRVETAARMDFRLLSTLFDLLDLVKKVKRAVLHEEQYYTKLKSVAIFEKHDYENIKRLIDDAECYLLNGFKTSSSYWKQSACELLKDIMTLMDEICRVEDNKENIKKFINSRRNDHEFTKRQLMTKSEEKTTPAKHVKRYSIKKENQVDTQMGLLSKAQPIVSIGKFKVTTKDHDGYTDRIKIKEIGDQRDRILKENEERAERQCLAKPRKSVHTVWNSLRVNTGANLENPKIIKDKKNNNAIREKDSTTTSPTSGDSRRKRQNSYNPPHPVWKPGGAVKSISGSTSSVLYAEQPTRRTFNAVYDKENSDLMRSVPVKHANPSEPTASGRNVLRDNRNHENFREERVTKLCKLFAQKVRKGSKNGTNALSETRSSMNTQSGIPLSDTSGTKIGVKSSQVNLVRQNSGSKPRPGVHKFNNFQRNIKPMFEAKFEPSPSKAKLTNKLERNDFSSDLSMKLNAKIKIGKEDVPHEKNLKESITSDTVKSSMLLPNDKDKQQNIESSKISDNELVKSISHTNSMTSNPQKSLMTTLNSNSTVNVDHELRSESRPSFVLLADASCNAEFSSTSNSTMMIPSSKCCQVSLSSSSSVTSLNYDRLRDKKQSNDVIPTIDKNSLESFTDDDSNDQNSLGFDPYRRKNKYELSLNSLKDFLHDLGIDADVIEKVETKYHLKKSNETFFSNLSNSFKTPLIKTSIESDSESTKTNEFKVDYIGSTETIGSLTDSINVPMEKIDEVIIERNQSKSSQTISNLKEFCDACTDVEDQKSDCSTYVDVTVSCNELELKTSTKDVCTEIFAEDNSILSLGRMVETQTNSPVSPIDISVELAKEDEEKEDNSLCIEIKDSKCEKPNNENEDHKSQHENKEESAECILNSEDGVTINESPLSECLIHKLDNIQEKLQNVDARLNKLQEPAKETSDAFVQINTITSSSVPKSIGVSTTPMTSEILKESIEEFNMDSMETNENCISWDVVNFAYSLAYFASNWYKALRIYRENKNSKRFVENEKGSTCGSTSEEIINITKKATFINAPCQLEKTELGLEKTPCFFERPSDDLNEPRVSDFSDESDETRSLDSSGYDDFYEELIMKPISRKSSCSTIFLETQDKIDKVQSSVSIKYESSATMKCSERIQDFNENNEEENVDDDEEEFVLSREALLLLTYLTVCAFVFCCLKFSMTCESLIL